jgi:uncharacterized repeat protein (TIGR03803 family)
MPHHDASKLAPDSRALSRAHGRGAPVADGRWRRRLVGGLAIGAIFLAVVSVAFPVAAAPYREEVLHLFPRAAHHPPRGRLVFDGAGNLYGITAGLGRHPEGGGSVFELSPQSASRDWNYTLLYTFCSIASCADGADPVAGLIIDANGNLYGITAGGGAYRGGTVFKLSYDATAQSWHETVLYSFCALTLCADGSQPNSLIMDGSGNLFGTASGSNASLNGIVFELSYDASAQSWHETTIYGFCVLEDCIDGSGPSSLVQDGAGNLYGATFGGGTGNSCGSIAYHFGCGTVFEFSYKAAVKQWKETVLYNFCPGRGGTHCIAEYSPNSIVMNGSGNLYGTTEYAGGNSISGAAFALTYSASDRTWVETVAHSFCSLHDCKDGARPLGLTVASSGSLYGATVTGGLHNFGTVFALNYDAAEQSWTFTRLYSFCAKPSCADGADPSGPVIIDTAGNLYGTTSPNPYDRGTVYRLQP